MAMIFETIMDQDTSIQIAILNCMIVLLMEINTSKHFEEFTNNINSILNIALFVSSYGYEKRSPVANGTIYVDNRCMAVGLAFELLLLMIQSKIKNDLKRELVSVLLIKLSKSLVAENLVSKIGSSVLGVFKGCLNEAILLFELEESAQMLQSILSFLIKTLQYKFLI
jgi:hypothetical protein